MLIRQDCVVIRHGMIGIAIEAPLRSTADCCPRALDHLRHRRRSASLMTVSGMGRSVQRLSRLYKQPIVGSRLTFPAQPEP